MVVDAALVPKLQRNGVCYLRDVNLTVEAEVRSLVALWNLEWQFQGEARRTASADASITTIKKGKNVDREFQGRSPLCQLLNFCSSLPRCTFLPSLSDFVSVSLCRCPWGLNVSMSRFLSFYFHSYLFLSMHFVPTPHVLAVLSSSNMYVLFRLPLSCQTSHGDRSRRAAYDSKI